MMKQRPISRVLEVGCYVGYAVLQLAPLLERGGQWYQVVDHETSHQYVDHVKQSIASAGLPVHVEVIVGTLEMAAHEGLRMSPFDAILLNHWEVATPALPLGVPVTVS